MENKLISTRKTFFAVLAVSSLLTSSSVQAMAALKQMFQKMPTSLQGIFRSVRQPIPKVRPTIATPMDSAEHSPFDISQMEDIPSHNATMEQVRDAMKDVITKVETHDAVEPLAPVFDTSEKITKKILVIPSEEAATGLASAIQNNPPITVPSSVLTLPEQSADTESMFAKSYAYIMNIASSRLGIAAIVTGGVAGGLYYYKKYYGRNTQEDILLQHKEAVIKFTKDLKEVVIEAFKELRLGQKGNHMRSSQELFGRIKIPSCIPEKSARQLGLKLQLDMMSVAYDVTQDLIREWHKSAKTSKVPSRQWYAYVYEGKANKYSVVRCLAKDRARIRRDLAVLQANANLKSA